MRKTIYALGIASFLAMLIFTIATSLTNPFYGMSEAAIAQTSTTTSSGTTICCDNENDEECARVIVNDVLHYFAGPKC